MLWHSAGYDVGRPRGGHLSWASICPHHNLPRRSASSITNMNKKRNLFQPLADRGPRNMVAAARLGSRVKQARPGHQPATASLALGCWNVRSLGPQTEATPSFPRKTALIDLELDRLGIQLASLSETWWYSSGSIKEEHYTIFWNGFENGEKPKQGVGIAARNTLLSCVEQPVFASPRLMSIRIRIRAGYITVISAYAPTLLASDEDKDEFYQQLSDLLSSILAGHDIALLGDFNARIGADADSWTSVIGRFGVGKINENGQRLLELCSLFNLSVASSFFKGSLRSNVMWMHPRSRRWHQLDHVIIRRRQLRGVKQCRSMHSADRGTDHALVRCKLQITLKKFHQT